MVSLLYLIRTVLSDNFGIKNRVVAVSKQVLTSSTTLHQIFMEQKIYKIKPEEIKEEKKKGKDMLSWQAQEIPSLPSSQEIILALGIIALGLIVFAVLTQNYLFMIIVVLAALIMYIQNKKGAQTIDFSISGGNISINKKIYTYEDFQSFWIFGQEHEHGRELVLHSKKRIVPLYLIPIAPGIDIVSLKNILSNHLPEIEERESLVDLLRKAFF